MQQLKKKSFLYPATENTVLSDMAQAHPFLKNMYFIYYFCVCEYVHMYVRGAPRGQKRSLSYRSCELPDVGAGH